MPASAQSLTQPFENWVNQLVLLQHLVLGWRKHDKKHKEAQDPKTQHCAELPDEQL